MPQLTSWSYSRLLDYEKCPYRVKLQFIDKVPVTPHPAVERGLAVHKASEDFIKGIINEIPPEYAPFEAKMLYLRDSYRAGKTVVEEEWAFTSNWESCDWKDSRAWLRLKLDAFVRVSPAHGVVVDHKTGKKSGNEIKHSEQGLLYAAVCYMKFPELERVTTEFNYVDQKEDSVVNFSPKQAARAIIMFEKRAHKMLKDTEFRPRPNIFNCRFCPYGPRGTGDCKVACPA